MKTCHKAKNNKMGCSILHRRTRVAFTKQSITTASGASPRNMDPQAEENLDLTGHPESYSHLAFWKGSTNSQWQKDSTLTQGWWSNWPGLTLLQECKEICSSPLRIWTPITSGLWREEANLNTSQASACSQINLTQERTLSIGPW